METSGVSVYYELDNWNKFKKEYSIVLYSELVDIILACLLGMKLFNSIQWVFKIYKENKYKRLFAKDCK